MIGRLGLAVIVLALALLAGCADDDDADTPSPTPAVENEAKGGDSGAGQGDGGDQSAGGWTGLQANTYTVAKEVCGALPLEKTATDLGLPPSSDSFTVAEEYSKGYTDEHSQPAFEGCLDGLP